MTLLLKLIATIAQKRRREEEKKKRKNTKPIEDFL